MKLRVIVSSYFLKKDVMVRIAVADNNPVYCQGLKAMLGQVDDFRIVILPPDSLNMQGTDRSTIDILLVDADLYLAHQSKTRKRALPVPEAQTILLTMEPDELPERTGSVTTLRKGSGKREFEEKIRELAETINPDQI